MQLYHLLLIPSLLCISMGIQQGCLDWTLNKSEVCCLQCHPGNRLVRHCGKDPSKLCQPCDNGTFVTNPLGVFCKRCRQCTDPQFVKEPCTASSDSVCGCQAGLRCGDPQCSYCVDECGKGEEPTDERTCRKCPNGTFNDKIHSKCKSHRTSCQKGEKLVAKGNKFRDNECINDSIPAPTTSDELNTVEILESKKKPKENTFWPLVGIAGGIAVVITVFILSLWFAHIRTKTKTKTQTKEPMREMLPQAELRVMMVEQDDACSFRQPEQEQGGSSESISTQDSETKLIA